MIIDITYLQYREVRMQFRDLRRQYQVLKQEIDAGIADVISSTNFISGSKVQELEERLAGYVGVKHCITCANGTDALNLALMAWDIGANDAVFVPDFTFFASGEVVSYHQATPVFVDVDEQTFNINPDDLEQKINGVIKEGRLIPRVIIAVDLFGQPADYPQIRKIAAQYGMKILEDSAQGFGGRIGNRPAGSFGDISTTSFFPAKPLGCYGDGGAIFTDHDEWAAMLKSLRIHGKGTSKYDNIRIGVNSRLDTLQAAILLPKLQAFIDYELEQVNIAADNYTKLLDGVVKTPLVKEDYYSSWAQYTIQLPTLKCRDGLKEYLGQNGIPSMVYYQKPMRRQLAFCNIADKLSDCTISDRLCERVLSLPIHPYFREGEQEQVVEAIRTYLKQEM